MSTEVSGTVKIVRLRGMAGGKDLHDYIHEHGVEAFRKLLDNPISADDLRRKEISSYLLEQKDQFPPMTLEDVERVLNCTIKGDRVNKSIVFYCAISAFSENGQFNISLNGGSSTGKTFIPKEVANLFPEGVVKIVGYASLRAFFHDYSYVKEDGVYVVSLERIILIFLDQPNTELVKHLRPLLSHDMKVILNKITDKNKSGFQTKSIEIVGYPAVIFCSACVNLDEQEATRFTMLSPDTSQEKIESSIDSKLLRESDREAFLADLEANPDRKALKARIRAIIEAEIDEIKVRDPEKIRQRFYEGRGRLKPRHARDIGRVLNIIKASALLNFWHREHEGNNIYVNDDDIDIGFRLWASISASQEFNLPPYVHDIYLNVIQPLMTSQPKGIVKQDIVRKYMQVYDRPIAEWQLRREILPMLETAGLIMQSKDLDDKRRMIIHKP